MNPQVCPYCLAIVDAAELRDAGVSRNEFAAVGCQCLTGVRCSTEVPSAIDAEADGDILAYTSILTHGQVEFDWRLAR